MTEIRTLIKSVEAGKWPDRDDVRAVFPNNGGNVFLILNDNSVDAALALMQAVLPGWDGSIQTNGECYVFHDRHGLFEAYVEDDPARALLLAILKAMEAQQ